MAKMMKRDYHMNIFYSAEDDAYIADIPNLKYCAAHGDTPEAALREMLIALEMTIAAYREQGKPLPTATYRPAYRTD